MHRFSYLKEFVENDSQKRLLDALDETDGNVMQAAELLGKHYRNVQRHLQHMKMKVALRGISPENDMIHSVPQGYNVEGVSTLYDSEGKASAQWVKSRLNKHESLRVAMESFAEGLRDEIGGLHKPIKPEKKKRDADKAAALLIGDHHLGMRAWSAEAGESWDLQKGQDVLIKAVDKLVGMTDDCDTGILINVGDFLTANGLNNATGAGTPQDVDGRYGKVIRASGNLFKIMINRMLQTYKSVWVINARGNHDPDASLWLNEMLKMYYERDKRVTVFDNFSKWVHFQWGDNLVVVHHGDKINNQRVHETVTRELAKEWGESKYRFAWLGHIHHKTAEERGGALMIETWSILPPKDAWHSGVGYGSQRSMNAVILDKKYGDFSRFKVGIDELI